MSDQRVVIAGAGLAGVHTAVRLRAQGWQGHITLVGAEHHPPYDRPPLSKDVLLAGARAAGGDSEVATGVEIGVETGVNLGVDLDGLGVELLLGRAATGLRVAERLLETTVGPLRYDHLVLATGAEAATLPGQRADGGAHVLRTLDDARRLRAALRTGGSLIAVGAGWLGAEVATAARAAGCEVTVLEAARQVLPGALPAEVTEPMRRWYRAAGVELRTGQPVAAARAHEVELAGGAVLGADAVLVGVGSRPVTAWLAGSGVALAPDGSVRADERLRTSVPGVYAVGDCASYPSARLGRRLLVHHWDNALTGPRTVAAAVMGLPGSHDPVPYFWSEQFGRRVQYAGHHGPGDRVVWRGSPGGGPDPASDPRAASAPGAEAGAWSVCWLRGDDALAAVLAVDRPRDLTQGRRLIERGARLDPVRAADPAVPLKAAVR